MKTTALKNNPRPLFDLSKEVAPGFIRLTRRGKLVAYVLLATHYDQEDVGYMTDPSFWEMIRERQNEPGIPWEQVKAELVGMDASDRTERPKAKLNGKKKAKRNGTARN